MTDMFSRRSVLGSLGALSALSSAGALAQDAAAPGTDPARAFFSLDELRFVVAAVDRLIPPDPATPGAAELGVPIYIDRQLAGPYGRGDRLYLAGPIKPGTPQQGYQLGLTPADLYRSSIRAIGEALAGRGGSLGGLPVGDQDAFLKDLEAGRVPMPGYSSAIFFETLLSNTIEGFFADPAYGGNRGMAGWKMIGFPGAYAAYLDLYTQHGLAFRREPIPMAMAGHHHHGHHRQTPRR